MKLYVARQPDGLLRLTDEKETAEKIAKGDEVSRHEGNWMRLYVLEFPEVEKGTYQVFEVIPASD